MVVLEKTNIINEHELPIQVNKYAIHAKKKQIINFFL